MGCLKSSLCVNFSLICFFIVKHIVTLFWQATLQETIKQLRCESDSYLERVVIYVYSWLWNLFKKLLCLLILSIYYVLFQYSLWSTELLIVPLQTTLEEKMKQLQSENDLHIHEEVKKFFYFDWERDYIVPSIFLFLFWWSYNSSLCSFRLL